MPHRISVSFRSSSAPSAPTKRYQPPPKPLVSKSRTTSDRQPGLAGPDPAAGSVREKHRHGREIQNVLGGAAEDDLAKPAAGEGALEHQVRPEISGLVEDGFARGTLPQREGSAARWYAVAKQMRGDLRTGGPGHHV